LHLQRYPKAINNEGRDRFPVVESSKSAANVVGGERHFLSAYRRFFDNPESHLFPTDYSSSPVRAAAAASAQRGGGGFEAPSHVLADPPHSFQSTTHRTHTEFDPEYLYQHPVRAFTSSAHSTLTQDRCYRTAPAQGLPVPRDCSLGDKFAYIRDGTGGYIVAETSVNPAAHTSKEPQQHHDHMFGAVQVLDEDSQQLVSPSGGHVQPRRVQSLPPVTSGFVTTNVAAFQDPSIALQQLNETAQQRTAAFVLDGSVPRKREVAFTLPGIFQRVNGIPTIVREKEVMYQMRVAKGQIRTPPRAKITSLSLEHEPLSVPVQHQ
jgi:hypothetical protein